MALSNCHLNDCVEHGFFEDAWDVLVTAGNFIDTRKSNGGGAVFYILNREQLQDCYVQEDKLNCQFRKKLLYMQKTWQN